MTTAERRASQSLAGIFALRMLGLFLVLPVFALEARHYPGGSDPALIGLAMGIYGLTQAVMQAPLGLASDRFGRKRVIVLGLLVFAAGSLWAALAGSVHALMAARALQGAGAVSAAATALLADLTRDAVRTKGMALVGISIGLVFALSLIVAPPLAARVGLPGLFGLTAVLALGGVLMVLWWTPPEPARSQTSASVPRARLADVWRHPHLWRLYLGIFVLHTVQMAMWSVLPALLVAAGLPKAAHWHVYLPAVLVSFLMLGTLFAMERRGQMALAQRAAIALLLLVQWLLYFWATRGPGIWLLGALLLLFFVAFNVLEASQPSLISRLAPVPARGAALGVYNTLQSLGLFAGGALGGGLLKAFGAQAVFAVAGALALLWLLLGWAQPMPKAPPLSQQQPATGQ
ncbi:MAG: MFS transporter [Burkholderiaceae bacterium]|jgi:predicted MFS family arabinose efflux permease|nr:MFS transporter [Burkholderiaceae bacterium]